MHTAEHILNQTMVRLFKCDRCFSAHIEKKKSKCDYEFGRDLTAEEKAELEESVNQVIIRGIVVAEDYLPRNEAEKLAPLDRLPNSDNMVRIVRVGDYDVCACSGPHVANTWEIGEFRLVSSDYTNGVLRLRFKLEPGQI